MKIRRTIWCQCYSLVVSFGVLQADLLALSPAGGNVSQEPVQMASREEQQRRHRFRNPVEKPTREYAALPPEQRVDLWLKGKPPEGLTQADMDKILTVLGTDTVPNLCEVVKRGGRKSAYAVKILCEMDRFVDVNETPMPEVGGTLYVWGFDIEGRTNWFRTVDGRRIGEQGLECVKWAAEQTRHKNLRFYARYCTGMLRQELRALPVRAQIDQFRKAVIKGKGLYAVAHDFGAYLVIVRSSEALVEAAPESIPLLVDLLKHDPNPYVKHQALTLLKLIDENRMRLRTSDAGRKAIEAMGRAFQEGRFKPGFEKDEWREESWNRISSELFNDQFPLHNGSTWAIIAMAFEKFYGEKVTKRYYTVQELVEATPEMREFATYLTNIDPFYPSWGYTHIGLLPADGVMHPRFRERIDRYYEHWKRFKAEKKAREQSN